MGHGKAKTELLVFQGVCLFWIWGPLGTYQVYINILGYDGGDLGGSYGHP